MNEIIVKIKNVYVMKGWRGVYHMLKKEGIEHVKTITEFGLDSNLRTMDLKANYIKYCPDGEFRAHLYSQSITGAKSGYKYNRIRAQSIILIPPEDTRELPCESCDTGEMKARGVSPSGQQGYECNICGHRESFP